MIYFRASFENIGFLFFWGNGFYRFGLNILLIVLGLRNSFCFKKFIFLKKMFVLIYIIEDLFIWNWKLWINLKDIVYD